MAAHAGDIDDRAAPAGTHARQDGARQGGGAEKIGFHERPELALRGLLQRADNGIAGIVDRDVDGAEMVLGGSDRALGVAGTVDIERDDQEPRLRLGLELRKLGGRAGGRHDIVALGQGVADEGVAETGGRARDEPCRP